MTQWNPETGQFDPSRDDPRGAFQTLSRDVAGAGLAVTSGRRYLSYFTALTAQQFTSLDFWTGAGAIVTVTAARLGLYTIAVNGDLTLVAQTANDPTIGATASAQFTRALDPTGGFPSAYTCVAGQRYAAAFYITAGTTPTALGATVNQPLATAAPRLNGFDNSGAGTDLNTTIANANISGNAQHYYLAGL